MHTGSRSHARKRSNRCKQRQTQQAITRQLAAYNNLVAAGIGLVKYWALCATIAADHIAVLSALLAFVDASQYSDKPRKAKTDAIGLALRAAYLYGKFGGQPPEGETAAKPATNPTETTNATA